MTIVKQRILAAFLNRGEVLGQAQMLNAVSDVTAQAKFWTDYTNAHAKLSTIQPLPSTPPELLPLGQEADVHLRTVEATTSFQENFGGFDYKFQLVPIERLIPIQIFVNLEPQMMPPEGTNLKGLLAWALPPDALIPSDVMITPSGFRYTSSRYGMGPQNIRRRIHEGNVVISFEHLNLVQVRKFGQILVLANGIHRAFEIAKDNRTHIPAIVIEHKNPNEYEWPSGPGFWSPQFVLATQRQPEQGVRPPLIRDFLTDLAVDCPVSLLPSVVEINVLPPTTQPTGAAQPIAFRLGGLVPQPQL